MGDEDDLRRLEQAWKSASGEVRRAFLVARYRDQGVTSESMIQIKGQVNVIDLAPRVAACAPTVRLGVGTGPT